MGKSRSKKIRPPKKIRPSRIKYDKNHPTVSARLPIEIRGNLRIMLESQGITLALIEPESYTASLINAVNAGSLLLLTLQKKKKQQAI